ncbi:hypothetical protein DXG01_002332 [Tephrocybe rancida]|nr:hypothetical protein DXG01_002332 [Tephrocybe rancida]
MSAPIKLSTSLASPDSSQSHNGIASTHEHNAAGTPQDNLNLGVFTEGMSEGLTSVGTPQTSDLARGGWSAADAPKAHQVLDKQGTSTTHCADTPPIAATSGNDDRNKRRRVWEEESDDGTDTEQDMDESDDDEPEESPAFWTRRHFAATAR